MLRHLLVTLALAASLASAAQAQAPAAPPAAAITTHSGLFNGQPVTYRAAVEAWRVSPGEGAASGQIITTSYVRTDPPAGPRPVIFLFNGGPGASTTPLHFGAFGPKRRLGEGAAQQMVDNPDSPLDAADLVFIDPVGTGYSRPLNPDDGQAFWTPTGDALSVKAVIADWLSAHGRETSPRYVLGQSYGTTRAALIAHHGADLNLDGVLLFALVARPPGFEMPYVTSLPSFAASAWSHGRIPREGRSAQDVYDQAVQFARTDYVSALIAGASLPPAEMAAVAQAMSALIGLPTDLILEKNLRLGRADFYLNLLKDQGLRTGQLDARATRPLDAPAQRPPYDDPGLSYTPPRPPGEVTGALPVSAAGLSAVESYFKEHLGFATAEIYESLNLEVNAAWTWGQGEDEANQRLAEAMAANPRLRVFWAAGLFDLSTPAYAGRYMLDQAGVPAERLTAALFASGHSVFVDPKGLTRLSAAVRSFVAP
ncbi:MAG: peptidase S10 [Phenylobacterium sp.]|uniref:S10 family peptidase n=1 Tax=Phenylobacterium sp. TaxID=1871053 RepID=UPI002727C748|nr:peptidase S10 [Phenylobacterium sp.]MDO8900077.1 peptidase S10 [Phenylobacterium sp.]